MGTFTLISSEHAHMEPLVLFTGHTQFSSVVVHGSSLVTSADVSYLTTSRLTTTVDFL